jgi:hypothetical protein
MLPRVTSSLSDVDPAEQVLAQNLAETLTPMGFVSRDASAASVSVPILGSWVRKTWNTNRAVVHLHAPPGEGELGQLAQKLKLPLGKALGYFPFFYGMGLQVVWSGRDIWARSARLKESVDAVDNQTCIIQSLFVVDLARGTFRDARTWGQVFTGKFQEGIAECLARAYRSET